MQASLVRVSGESDADKPRKAIRELYAEDAVLNEPHASIKGHVVINGALAAAGTFRIPPADTFHGDPEESAFHL